MAAQLLRESSEPASIVTIGQCAKVILTALHYGIETQHADQPFRS
jgi:hypothetical protein